MEQNLKILVGKIVASHGVRGEVRAQTFTTKPTDFNFLKIYTDKFNSTQIHFIRQLNSTSSVVILKIDGITDRNLSDTLRGMNVFVDRDTLDNLNENEYYQHDLIGFTVLRDNIVLGTVNNFQNFGAGDIIELDNGNMVAFSGACVDVKNKKIMVN